MDKYRFFGHNYSSEITSTSSLPRLSAIYYCTTFYNDHADLKVCHPYWTITYAMTDCGFYRFGHERARKIHNIPGTAWIIPPQIPFWEDFRGIEKPAKHVFIDFYGGEHTLLTKFVDTKKGYGTITDNADGILKKTILSMAESAGRLKDGGFYKGMALLYDLLNLFNSARTDKKQNSGWHIPDSCVNSELSEGIAMKIRSFFLSNLKERHSMSALASRLGMSVPAIFRHYRKESGESPMKSLMNMRIEAAKSLLARDMPVKRIVTETGFFDESHFSRCFKQIAGTTPGQFARCLNKS